MIVLHLPEHNVNLPFEVWRNRGREPNLSAKREPQNRVFPCYRCHMELVFTVLYNERFLNALLALEGSFP